MCSFRKQSRGQHFLSHMQQQLHSCPRLYLTSPCPPDQPGARARLPYLHVAVYSSTTAFFQHSIFVYVDSLPLVAQNPSRTAASPCLWRRSCLLSFLAFACWPSTAIPSTEPRHPLPLPHTAAGGAWGADIAKPFGGLRALRGKEERNSIDLWGGGGEQSWQSPSNYKHILFKYISKDNICITASCGCW